MSEEDFWKMEPRIFIALLESHKEIELEKIKTQAIYTACYVWGKNPEEFEKPKEIPGIDVPVDPALLRGFYV